MQKTLVVDGCNAVRTHFGFKPGYFVQDDINSASFLDELSSWGENQGPDLSLEVIFDGRVRQFPRSGGRFPIHITFSERRKADDVIVQRVRMLVIHRQPVRVVTADRALAASVAEEGAKVIPSRLFWERWLRA